MSGCDPSAFGSGFESKVNKTSQPIPVAEIGGALAHNVKDADGKIVESREFRPGTLVYVANDLKPGEEIDPKKFDVKDLKPRKVESFWTVVDGEEQVSGAEIAIPPFGKRRLPLRMLLPIDPVEVANE